MKLKCNIVHRYFLIVHDNTMIIQLLNFNDTNKSVSIKDSNWTRCLLFDLVRKKKKKIMVSNVGTMFIKNYNTFNDIIKLAFHSSSQYRDSIIVL